MNSLLTTRIQHVRTALLIGAVASMVMSSALLGGCGKEEPPPPVVAAPPPPPPPPPAPVKTVAELMEELRIDPRVELGEDRAPGSTAARKAILEFFDAFARGDDRALAGMLDARDRRELEAMVQSGDWERATSGISRIEIYQTGRSEHGDCALALFEVNFDEQPQLWYYSQANDGFTFRAAPTPPGILSRLSGVDWIEAWHGVLRWEDEEAARADTPVSMPQRVLEDAGGISAPGGTPSGPDSPPTTPPITPAG